MKKQNEEEQLQKQLADYARFPEMNPGPVCRIDISGKVLLSNKAARNLFGENNLLGVNWLKICPGFNEELWEEILNAKEPLSIETEINDKFIMFNYILSEDRNLIFAFGTDITELRLVEKQLANYARFPNMNPAPVLRLDLEGNVLLSNSAALQVFGYDLEGQCWRDVCDGLKDDNVWKSICEAIEEPYYTEVRVGDKDFMFAHRRDAMSTLLFAFGADITQTKKAEQALRQSEKMATLGTLAAGVAHELNNPAAATIRAAEQLKEAFINIEKSQLKLSTIKFSEEELKVLQMIEQQAREYALHPINLNPINRSDIEAEIESWLSDHNIENTWELAPHIVDQGINKKILIEYYKIFPDNAFIPVIQWAACIYPVYSLLNEIKQSSTRISEIVGALRSYTYLGKAPVQLINIHEGIDNTLIILNNKIKEGISIIREYSRDLPMISAYGSELNQVWTNILDNAIDAINGQGEIIIRTKKDINNIIIEIEDNGSGIPKDIQSKVFDPFFTTKEPGKGTGLGLSTSYSIIVDKHNGEISVSSRPGKTCFRIALPIKLPRDRIEKN